MKNLATSGKTSSDQANPTGSGWRGWAQRGIRLLFLLLLALVLAGCAAGEAPPAAICDTYDRSLYTAQLIGGALLLLALAVLGFKKQAAAILPTQGAQVGAIAGTVFVGLILLAFSTQIGGQILTGFGLPDLYTLCGL